MKKIVSIAIILIALVALVSCEEKTTITLLSFDGSETTEVEFFEDEVYGSLGQRIGGTLVTVGSFQYVQYSSNADYYLMNDHVVIAGEKATTGIHKWTLTIDLTPLFDSARKYAFTTGDTFEDIATSIGGQVSGNIIVNANDQNYMLSLSGSPNPVTKTTTVTAGDYVWAPIG